MNSKSLLYLLTLIVLTFNSLAELKLPNVLGNGMVLQRDLQVPIWGWAKPGDEIKF